MKIGQDLVNPSKMVVAENKGSRDEKDEKMLGQQPHSHTEK